MRAPTRFMLDIALMTGLVTAYQPTWTGVTLHQWLSIAIIVPLLLHVIVNWEWAVRVLRTFIQRLLSTSRLNFVVDAALLVAAVAVMLSGFMVSPALIAPLGIRPPSNPLAWHIVHSWSANATISLLAAHGLLHWRWLLGTAKRMAEPLLAPGPRRRRRGVAGSAVPGLAAASQATQPTDPFAPRPSRVGSRAIEAAAERAMALRTATVLGVTAALGVALFAGVGLVSPLFATASASASASASGPQSRLIAKADVPSTAATTKKTRRSARTTRRTASTSGRASSSPSKAASASKKTATAARPKAVVAAPKTRVVAAAKPGQDVCSEATNGVSANGVLGIELPRRASSERIVVLQVAGGGRGDRAGEGSARSRVSARRHCGYQASWAGSPPIERSARLWRRLGLSPSRAAACSAASARFTAR